MAIENNLKSDLVLDISTKTIVNLLQTGSWINRKSVLFFKQYNLSTQQYNILKILRGQKKRPTSLVEINERLISEISNTSRHVDKLKFKRYVTKKMSTTNLRKSEIRITNKGLMLLSKIDEEIDDFMGKTTEHLNRKEALILNELLDKIRGRINW